MLVVTRPFLTDCLYYRVLHKLRTLWLQGNPIQKLPKGMKALKHLESVKMPEPVEEVVHWLDQ